jgi:hypothetical protein
MAERLPGSEAHARAGGALGFVPSAAVRRHRPADPLLPVELRPLGWPGDALRHDYERYDQAYRTTLRHWFTTAT